MPGAVGDMCGHRRLAEPVDMCASSSDNAGEPSADHVCLREKIKSVFGKYNTGDQYTHIRLPKASILLPLLLREGKLHLLMTVRSIHLQTMPGDVCFPGGRKDPSDEDDIQTALRETKEEIGLRPEQVKIIGRLMPCVTKAPIYLVSPIVGIVEDTFEPILNPSEVADVFFVPLEFFISSEHYTPVELNMPPYEAQVIHKFLYIDAKTKKTFTIWGLTAYCAVMLSVILLEKKPSFDPEFDIGSSITKFEKFMQAYYSHSKL